MEHDEILHLLNQPSKSELDLTSKLRQNAYEILHESKVQDDAQKAATSHKLLTEIIKPLFTASKHPALTSSGRKNLVSSVPVVGRFNSPIDHDTKLWKTSWTVPLLIYILSTYRNYSDINVAKSTLESQFPLLTPAILNILDDIDYIFKTSGCLLLAHLCKSITETKSTILSRSGLTEVFISALRPNFSALPTLTPEDESLTLLEQLYPAYLALIEADSPVTASFSPHRQTNLDTLLCHGILSSISHLANTNAPVSSSISLPITTLLLSQLAPIISAMQVNASKHLQNVIPLLRAVLADPFVASAPESMLACLDAVESILEQCKERVRDRWWVELLRALVAAWCVIVDEEVQKEVNVSLELTRVKDRLQKATKMLGEVVGSEFDVAKDRLLKEEDDMAGLFE